MKNLVILNFVALFIIGCNQSSSDTTCVSTKEVNMPQLKTIIRQSVQDIDRKVVVGKKTTDRINETLSKQLAEFHLKMDDTNLVVDVNCGDPIYHIELGVSDGKVSIISVKLTPVCPE